MFERNPNKLAWGADSRFPEQDLQRANRTINRAIASPPVVAEPHRETLPDLGLAFHRRSSFPAAAPVDARFRANLRGPAGQVGFVF